LEVRKEVQQINRGRRDLIVCLVVILVSTDIVILLGPNPTFSGDISRILAIGFAAILSLVVVGRQGIAGIFGRAYLAISVGIILWLMAETIWGYYEIVLQVEKPFPSLADAFWLAGYGPLGYHLFTMSRFYGRGVKKYKIALVLCGIAVFSGIYIQQLLNIFESTGETSQLGLAISITYPVIDAILFMPAIVIVWNAGKGHLTSIPWIFIAWISMGTGDTLLGIAILQNFQGSEVIVNSFYLIAYLCMGAGIWWYNRFFILDKKKIQQRYNL
jgi:hypothetical protein